MSEKSTSRIRVISYVMIITFAGKLLGLFRDRLLTINYGSGMATNAFLTASRIPRVFFDAVFASAIAVSFIPVFNEYFSKKGKKEAIDFSGNFITVIGLFSLLLTVLGIALAEPLVTLFADGYDAETTALCVSLTRIMFPTVLLTGIAYSFVGILQSFDEFNIPALISVISNGVIILYFYLFNDRFGIYGLAAAFIIGWLMQAIIQVPSLRKKGFSYRPSANVSSPGMKKVLTLMLPVMVSTWVQPINQTINSKFGSHLFDGSGVSAIELSNNLYTIIIGVFILSVTNVMFPHLSKLSAENETMTFNKTISQTVRTSLYFVIPMMAGLIVLAAPLVNFIYGGGAFDAFSVFITSRALRFVSLGMIGFSLQAILCRAYFAQQNGRIPLLAGAISIGVNIVLCILLVEKYDITGLAIASAVAATVNAVILIIPLQFRGVRILSLSMMKDLIRVTIAALLMALVAWTLLNTLDGVVTGSFSKLVLVLVPTAAGVFVYFLITLLLGLTEAKKAFGYLKRAFGHSHLS